MRTNITIKMLRAKIWATIVGSSISFFSDELQEERNILTGFHRNVTLFHEIVAEGMPASGIPSA
jgi:hypothetical protein